MAVLSPTPKQQFFDANGVPLVGGKLYSYAAGTTTPLATYASSTEATFNTNPIILNSRGEAEVWLGSRAYKFKLTTAVDVDVWTVDNIKTTGNPFVSVTDYGTNQAAIVAAFAAATEVYFPPGIYAITSDLTIPAGKVIAMNAGAAFVVSPGVTLTIYAQFNGNPDSHHFQGAGSVIGIGEVYPEWFGALGDSTTDDAAAFNKTIPCVKASLPAASNGVVRMQAKSYLLNSSWVVEQTASAGVDLIGTGTLLGDTRLLGGVSFTGALVNIQGNTNPIGSIVDFKLSGFALISQNVGQGQGLVFNTVANNRINGLQQSIVENIHIGNFSQGLYIRNSRLIKFSRVSVWNTGIDGTLFANANVCLIIIDGAVGEFDFVGDLSFDNCQFVQNKQFWSKVMQINAQSANSAIEPVGKTVQTVSGIRFTECIFYRGGNFSVQLTASNYSRLNDIWFTNCQLDDTSGTKIDTSSANAFITNVNYQGNYHTAVAGNCVRLDAFANNGRINSINIANNYSAGVFDSAAVVAVGVHGINVNGNRWSGIDWAVGAAMLFDYCSHVVCNDNNMGRAGNILYGVFNNMVQLSGTGNYYVVVGNNSAGRATGALINNTTGAANTAIANNI